MPLPRCVVLRDGLFGIYMSSIEDELIYEFGVMDSWDLKYQDGVSFYSNKIRQKALELSRESIVNVSRRCKENEKFMEYELFDGSIVRNYDFYIFHADKYGPFGDVFHYDHCEMHFRDIIFSEKEGSA